jgi:hypothetical protein
MNQQIRAIFLEVRRQLFGTHSSLHNRRSGTLILTRHTVRKMAQYRIDGETLDNAFRHGIEIRAGTIIHTYPGYSIGLYYKADESPSNKPSQPDERFVITTCWRGK